MPDADRCPRCGQPNSCAQASREQPVQDCWCFHTPIKQSALDELPAELRDQTCLCPNCARALSDTSH
ncbi:cysteine-rich CWC family protein [Pseudomonas sp. PDM16]|uniref:cysteine-rich CWC family protein n=1 Tax=Pseudomonas sp. PDM16 TaxID=2769292 RepID=UPI00178337D2|nr:cysteine-rich CWC family protein [Pseudomonas sp. PDM16]MBD9414237.1 cysteine-rich CWC family protein [Pseudomonas sp. PDM16]